MFIYIVALVAITLGANIANVGAIIENHVKIPAHQVLVVQQNGNLEAGTSNITTNTSRMPVISPSPSPSPSAWPCNYRCSAPRKPMPPVVSNLTVVNAMNLSAGMHLVVRWGSVSRTPLCESTFELVRNASGSTRTVYKGESTTFATNEEVGSLVTFRLNEINCVGHSEYSDLSFVNVPDPSKDITSPPALSSVNESSICVEWEDPGHDIVTVLYRRTPDVGKITPSWGSGGEYGGEGAFCAHNLLSSTSYDFRIKLHADPSKLLTPPLSPVLTVKTDVELPLIPLAPAASNATEDTINLMWSRPSHKSNRSPANKFFVEAARLGSLTDFGKGKKDDLPPPSSCKGAQFAWVANSTRNFAVIEDLESGTVFCFRTRAKNIAGITAPSEPGVGATLPTVPEKITSFNFTKVQQMDVRVDWIEPRNNGANILGYEVDLAPLGIALDFYEVYNGKKTHALIRGLFGNTRYGFRVRAKNRRGPGPWSAQYNVVTMAKDGESMQPEELAAASVPFMDSPYHQTR